MIDQKIRLHVVGEDLSGSALMTSGNTPTTSFQIKFVEI